MGFSDEAEIEKILGEMYPAATRSISDIPTA